MTYPENVRHGLWGVVGILIPSLIVVAAYGVPSIVAFVAIFMAFMIGEQRGKRETGDSYREVLQEAHDDLKEAKKIIDILKDQKDHWYGSYKLATKNWHQTMDSKYAALRELAATRGKLDIAGKKVQRLTERFVRNGK